MACLSKSLSFSFPSSCWTGMAQRSIFSPTPSGPDNDSLPAFNSVTSTRNHIVKTTSGMTTLKFGRKPKQAPNLSTFHNSTSFNSAEKPPLYSHNITQTTIRPIPGSSTASPSFRPLKVSSPSLASAMQRSSSTTPKLPPISPSLMDISDTFLPSFSSLTHTIPRRDNSQSPSQNTGDKIYSLPDCLFHPTEHFLSEFRSLSHSPPNPDWFPMNTSSHQLNPYIYNDGSTRNIISSPATRPIQAKPPPNLLSPNDSFAEDLDQLVKTLAMSQCEVYGKLRLVSGIRKVLNNLLAKQKTILQESQNAGGPAQSTSPQNVPSGQDRYKLYLYGSFSNLSTSLPQSDVDICIVTEQQQSFITQIQQCLLSIVAGWMSNTSEIRTTPFLHNHSQAISLTDGPQVPSVNASPTLCVSSEPSIETVQTLLQQAYTSFSDSLTILESLSSALQSSGLFTETKLLSKTRFPVVKVHDQSFCLNSDDETNSIYSGFSSTSDGNSLLYPTSINLETNNDHLISFKAQELNLIAPHTFSSPLSSPIIRTQSAQQVSSCSSPSVDYIQHLSHDSVHPHADISAGSINGIINSDLLRELLFYYPPAPTIIFLAKSILSKHHLNEPYIGGIGGYSLSLLVVSHLQMFQRNFNKDWHTTPLFELFLSFLQLYGEDDSVPHLSRQPRFSSTLFKISIKNGGSYPNWTQEEKDDSASLSTMSLYQNQIFIEDPLLNSVNTAHNCTLYPQIRHLFASVYHSILDLYPDLQSSTPNLSPISTPLQETYAFSSQNTIISSASFVPRNKSATHFKTSEKQLSHSPAVSPTENEVSPSLQFSSPHSGHSILLPIHTSVSQSSPSFSPSNHLHLSQPHGSSSNRQLSRISQLSALLGITQTSTQGRMRYRSYTSSCRLKTDCEQTPSF